LPKKYDLLVYADMARWELTLRQRRGEIGDLAWTIPRVDRLQVQARFLHWIGALRIVSRKHFFPNSISFSIPMTVSRPS